jgi:hypothetical protein
MAREHYKKWYLKTSKRRKNVVTVSGLYNGILEALKHIRDLMLKERCITAEHEDFMEAVRKLHDDDEDEFAFTANLPNGDPICFETIKEEDKEAYKLMLQN